MKFEILHKLVVPIPDAPQPQRKFAIDIWIDGILMNDSACDKYPWLNLYENGNWRGPVQYFNAAHDKYLHDLHALHYAAFKENMARITEEIIADTMHPRRLIRHLDLGGDIEDF